MGEGYDNGGDDKERERGPLRQNGTGGESETAGGEGQTGKGGKVEKCGNEPAIVRLRHAN